MILRVLGGLVSVTILAGHLANAATLCPIPDPAVAEDYVATSSKRAEDKIVPAIKERFAELVSKTPSTRFKSFARGQMTISAEGLVWIDQSGNERVLLRNEDVQERHALSGFIISPDSSKVAFNTTVGGQDLKHWNVVTISENPQVLLERPALNRMSDFSWNKNSTGFYYSFFHPKDEVARGEKPIVESRFRDLASGEDRTVFSHGLAENFAIADLDGGETLAAYRLLNPSVGIKTTFSMYKGVRQSDGSYLWKEAYPRNKYVAVFLGVLDGKVILHSSEAGNNYGIVSVDVLNHNRRRVMVRSKWRHVLHTAEVAGEKLILQYHSIPRQNVSLRIYDPRSRRTLKKIGMRRLGLNPFGNLLRFQFAPGGKTARTIFSDVFKGNNVLEMNIERNTIRRLPNEQNLDFDARKVRQRLVQFRAKDGTRITGRLYTRRGKRPSFVFLRYYGWISIKNSPEPREVQMALELGGAYLTLDLPGGGERGADWFIRGSRNRLQMIRYISEASHFAQRKFRLGPEKIVALGRSWGGLTSLILAARHGDNFGIINPIVPVIDMIDMFENGNFGRIAHSDLAPHIDKNGDYILDRAFFDYAESISPIRHICKMKRTARIHLFTSGLDDRVDQGGEQEAKFARAVENQVSSAKFNYHRSIRGNHGSRFYQVLVFSLIADHYGLKYTPLRRAN